ncbi:MAG: LptA/OstA family protein, partial [Hyphomicrobium sp.]
HRLQSDRKAGRTRVTSPAADGGDGRIAARFYRNAPSGADGAKTSAAPTVGGGLGAATFKTDPNAPVDINADSLDINDQRKAAVFVGDVMAVQGGFTLRTAEMTAFYTGEAGLGGSGDAATAPAKDQGAKGGGAKGGAELQRIEARKSVIVKSQDGQTATGDWANFDTKRNVVVVGGDVVLTQGQNVIRGSRLNIDMTTGKSTIETDPTAAWSARAQPTDDGKSGGKAAFDVAPIMQHSRPSAVFYPKSLKDKSAAGAAPAAVQAKPSDVKKDNAWGAVTQPATRLSRERDN